MIPTPYDRFRSMLRLAHAIEIGAYHAYEGHWRSIKPLENVDRLTVKLIQVDELEHREVLREMMRQTGTTPSWLLDSVMYVIGRMVSATCYLSPAFAKNYGASVMEVFAIAQYDTMADLAHQSGMYDFGGKLTRMAETEEAHRQFFKGVKSARNRIHSTK